MWKVVDRFADKNCFSRCYKKRPREFASCFANLKKFTEHLDGGGTPESFKSGFMHPEPKGVFAIGQSKVRYAQEMRLYVYPEKISRTLYVITIGTKSTQHAQLQICFEIAATVNTEIEGRDRTGEVAGPADETTP